ncbi:hypothetical protein D3C73_1416710 [compost metagenome]
MVLDSTWKNEASGWVNATAIEMMAQLSMMRAIQNRAPYRCSNKLLGTSNKK